MCCLSNFSKRDKSSAPGKLRGKEREREGERERERERKRERVSEREGRRNGAKEGDTHTCTLYTHSNETHHHTQALKTYLMCILQ